MTQAKHTPAPWLYENGKGIKACGNPLKVTGRTKVAIANRALIAAAPELFAALEAADRYLSDQQHNLDYPHGLTGINIKAALAKAKAGV